MTLEAARAAHRDARIPVVAQQLAARVSRMSTRDEFRDFLESISRDVLSRGDLEHSKVAELLINGALRAAKGEHALLSTKEAAVDEQFKGNRYVGIGIALRTHDDSHLTQVATLLDGPGAKAGLKMDDLLVACDGKSLSGKSIQEVVDLLRGPAGTQLLLDVRSPGDPPTAENRALKITRSIVPFKTVQGMANEGDVAARHRVDLTAPIAYVRLTRIGASGAQELEQLEPQLVAAGFEALILDLRNLGSGDLHHAVLFIDALLDQGLIGKVQTTTGSKEFVADRDCLFRDWPIAVLVDASTRGTAEWVAAALQDRQRSTIIGLRTAGEPFVSSFVPIRGRDETLLVATGLLERDKEAEQVRIKRIGSQARPPNALTPSDEPSIGEELRHDAWRVTPDHVPAGVKELYMRPQTPMSARPRARPAGGGTPSVTPIPQSPPAEPLAKAPLARDHFIADALETLQGQLRQRKASSAK